MAPSCLPIAVVFNLLLATLFAFDFDVYLYSRGFGSASLTDTYGGGDYSQIKYIDLPTQATISTDLVSPALESGLNIVVIDEYDSMYIESQGYYVYGGGDAAMNTYLNSLPTGRIILIVAYDTAEMFTSTAATLTSWGSTCGTPGWRQPFIFVGQVGGGAAWTYCQVVARDGDPINATFTIPFVQTWSPTEEPTNAPTLSPLDEGVVGQYCVYTVDVDTVPNNPGITTLPNEATLNDKISGGWSELVDVPTQGFYDENGYVYPRANCPHLWNGLTSWESLFPDQTSGDIVLPINTRVIITKCSLEGLSNPSFNRIYVPFSSHLIFDDSEITLNVREILVEGILSFGSDSCRLYSKITVNLIGDKASSNYAQNYDWISVATSKGIVVENGGVLEMHGKQYIPTWTRLARIVNAGDTYIYLQDCVNWEVGQQILLTTTVWFDCADEYKDAYCYEGYSWQGLAGYSHQNEIFDILAIDSCNVLQINGSINHTHWASHEYQGEVALLTRRIRVQGQRSTDSVSNGFGAHIIVKGNTTIGRIRGVHCDFCGQLNVLGRYPFHLHLLGNGNNAQQSYFQDNVVTHSQFRCYTIHGTNKTYIARNIAYNVYGMCYYLEDGVEEEVTLEYNMAAHIHPISEPADCCGQPGEDFVQHSGLVVPADSTASGFYIPNAYNRFIGNVASGGWAGFAFPNCPYPLGQFKNEDWGYNNPLHRPLLEFYGNTAHSSGFYWREEGTCVYIGAWLYVDSADGLMKYNSGRNERTTVDTGGGSNSVEFMHFEHTKTFLCAKGISHWGNQIVIEHYESHDVLNSAQCFGECAMYNAIVTGRTDNTLGWTQQEYHYYDRKGFRFYDTYVKIILSQIEFRNYTDIGATTTHITEYLDHSDHYTPQGINAMKAITLTNVDPTLVIGIDHCGAYCGDYHETVASQIYSIYDWDGSVSGTNKKTIIGSYRSWWNVDDTACSLNVDWNVYHCEWRPSMQIGYLDLVQPGVNDNGCDQTLTDNFKFAWCALPDNGYGDCSCTDQFSGYTTATVSQWGDESKNISMHGWPGVAGITNTGWYWRPYWGAIDYFEVGSYQMQLARASFIVLAVKYPSTATFTVDIYSTWASSAATLNLSQSTYAEVTATTEDVWDVSAFDCSNAASWYSLCTDATLSGGFVTTTGGIGPAWHFDGTYLYVRVVNLQCYSSSYHASCEANYFQYDNVKIWDVIGGFTYRVTASCPGCTAVYSYNGRTYWHTPDVVVPNPFPATWRTETLKPTPSPTPFPTILPTPSPTAYTVTSPPTASSQSAPTQNPSENPSQNPTKNPSQNPTQNPTRNPSQNPTKNPTKNPSQNPTSNPTPSPTYNPLIPGTPTNSPIPAPTKNPTTSPTFNPTKNPTISPTTNPTKNPTKNPTISQTLMPTKNPTISPTSIPTYGPLQPGSPTKAPVTIMPSTHNPTPSALTTASQSIMSTLSPRAWNECNIGSCCYEVMVELDIEFECDLNAFTTDNNINIADAIEVELHAAWDGNVELRENINFDSIDVSDCMEVNGIGNGHVLSVIYIGLDDGTVLNQQFIDSVNHTSMEWELKLAVNAYFSAVLNVNFVFRTTVQCTPTTTTIQTQTQERSTEVVDDEDDQGENDNFQVTDFSTYNALQWLFVGCGILFLLILLLMLVVCVKVIGKTSKATERAASTELAAYSTSYTFGTSQKKNTDFDAMIQEAGLNKGGMYGGDQTHIIADDDNDDDFLDVLDGNADI